MKRTYKSMSGVTLLEIMLVLAIAALVIVMSIRFYQSASSSQKINTMVSLAQGITAASENYFNSNASSYDNLDNTTLAPYMPNNSVPNTPWGGAIEVTGSGSALTISPSGIPTQECLAVKKFLETNNKYSVDGSCVIKYNQGS